MPACHALRPRQALGELPPHTKISPSAIGTASAPALHSFGAQSHGLQTPCVRFAGWVAPPPRNTRFRLLAHLAGLDWLPAGSLRKVSRTIASFPLSQALPGALQDKCV
jgi:hypothetical protein